MPPTSRPSWMPQSLASRVFVLYAGTLLLSAVLLLGLLTYQQFVLHVRDTRASVERIATVAIQPVTESAIIGDFDSIERLLGKIAPDSALSEATYIDRAGGRIAVRASVADAAPGWLTTLMARQLPDRRLQVEMGGRVYGELVLRFDAGQIAGDLWALSLRTGAIIFLGLLGGLAAMRYALRRWLGSLDRLQVYEAQVRAGAVDAEAVSAADAPLEIRQAIEAVNRMAGSLRSQFGQRIDFLMHSLVQHKKAMDEATIVCELDREGRLTYANERFSAALRLPHEVLIGRRLSDLAGAADPQGAPWQPGEDIWHGEVAIQVGGQRRWHQRSIVPIFAAEGGVEKYICIDIDVTGQKASEAEIRDQVRRQHMVTRFGQTALAGDDVPALSRLAVDLVCDGLHVSYCALVVQGDDGVPRVVAGAGWRPGWVGGDAVREAQDGAPPALHLAPDMVRAHGIRSLLAMQSDDGTPRRFALVAGSATPGHAFHDADRDFLRSLAHVLAAAMERSRSREHLTYLAQFDALTGLPNRRLLLERLEHAVAAARSHGGRLGMLYLDLDRFKLVNDTLGHEAGDRLLVQAAQRMVGCLRASDTVARLSGDEFAVLLPGLDAMADAERVGRKLLEQLSRPFDLDGHEAFVSASVGAAIYPDDALDAAALVRSADRAMYASKAAGRNTFLFYDPRMEAQASDQLALQTQLRGALEREEFFLVYQPRVDLASGRICGAEALLRWRHPERGVVSPAEFIPVLEDTGMIIAVGEWVLREVATQAVRWQAQGLAVPRLAVNLSARQFGDAQLDGQVRAVLAETGVDPALLEFELTESMLMQEPAAAAAILRTFRGYGLHLSIDDFGTGYSSLAYLRRFPIDALKIDRAFVRDITRNPDDAAITRAIISLAHSLKLRVVAEGVETTDQLDILSSRGCDEIQGFYFSPPVEADAFAELLRTGRGLVRQRRSGQPGPGRWRLSEIAA